MYEFPISKLLTPNINDTKKPLILVGTGSFNPITYMHLRMMEMAKDYFKNEYQVIGGYLSPVGDGYDKKTLIESLHRTSMVELSIEDSNWLMMDRFESNKPTFTPTRQVLDHIKLMAQDHLKSFKNIDCNINVVLVCGADLLGSFNIPKLWSENDMNLLSSKDNFGIAVISRNGSNLDDIISNNQILTKNKDGIFMIPIDITNDVSSTKIREKIRNNLSIKYLMPDKALNYINSNNIYKTEIPDFRNKL
ncbi:hypothetical protein RB653_008851 [Dictyostelium firmibasis]|uniref:Nicotinamide-nucleotide adenylyltransferase n=1 Tax=Dictyostelium firmibasis TaxID=79012 RepID=A0AAN7YWX1_9MYCE